MHEEATDEELTPPWEQLDAGIVPAVRALWIAGCIPWTSCEGGEGHLKPHAFVGLASSVETLEADAQLAIRTLIDAGFRGFEVSRITSHKDSVEPDEIFPAYISVEFAESFAGNSGGEKP